MDSIGTGEFIDRFEPFERFECHTGFELCTVLFPLCRHRPSSPLPRLLTQHSILMTCPVFGAHYSLWIPLFTGVANKLFCWDSNRDLKAPVTINNLVTYFEESAVVIEVRSNGKAQLMISAYFNL